MSNNTEELKKELAQALRTFQIDISEELTEKRDDPEEDRRDFEEMSIATREKIEELTTKSDQVVQKSGLSREALEAFGANPNNFTPEQWEALQKIREVAAEYKKITLNSISPDMHSKIADSSPKKAKSRKAKKKDWIPL